jgi:pSer/pThr/pTyr-binding forkhead associated (FHA) protein
MSVQGDSDFPRLVILTPERLRGQVLRLVGRSTVIGRDPSCNLVLEDPHVSRTHAVIRTEGNRTVLEDMDSSGGTTVNGTRAARTRDLRSGDVISFATVRARYETQTADLADTWIAPAVSPAAAPARATPGWAEVHYEVGQQDAGAINNVGRDQFNAYTQQRESFLRDVAATKSKARILAWLGFLFLVIGFAVYGGVIVRFFERLPSFSAKTQPQDIQLLGPDVAGIPVGVLALALFLLGSILLTIGIILHIVSAARRRRVNRDMPFVSPPNR